VHLTKSGFTSWHGFASGILDHLKRHSIELRASAVIPDRNKRFSHQGGAAT
jgi:dTDP-4-dehydrorhamnose reductase